MTVGLSDRRTGQQDTEGQGHTELSSVCPSLSCQTVRRSDGQTVRLALLVPPHVGAVEIRALRRDRRVEVRQVDGLLRARIDEATSNVRRVRIGKGAHLDSGRIAGTTPFA